MLEVFLPLYLRFYLIFDLAALDYPSQSLTGMDFLAQEQH